MVFLGSRRRLLEKVAVDAVTNTGKLSVRKNLQLQDVAHSCHVKTPAFDLSSCCARGIQGRVGMVEVNKIDLLLFLRGQVLE